ncbi:6359_t:CDS:1, partial [Acaulospora morrowiae]
MANNPLNTLQFSRLSGLPPQDHSQPWLPTTISSLIRQPILTPVSTHQNHVSSETLSSDSRRVLDPATIPLLTLQQ